MENSKTIRDEGVTAIVDALVSAGVVIADGQHIAELMTELYRLDDVSLGLRRVESQHILKTVLTKKAQEGRN